MTDVIFIGAGPIGLLAAIQLKMKHPEKEIIMFEKHETPIRNHAMYVEQSSFANMDKRGEFGAILDSIPNKVIISDLEKTLRAYAVSIGITIHFEDIRDSHVLKIRYPNTDYFIGSGGLRGIIHPQVFHGDNQINDTLRYAIEVKYKALGKARPLHKINELPNVLGRSNHLVSEYVGHLKDGVTPISLRIFVNEETYEAMKEATFRSPFTLADEHRIPVDLYQSIRTYLLGRDYLTEERIEEGSLKISSITLSIYASRQFCGRVDGKTFFKIGEEGFACPFYRSFNDNALCIPYFTQAMGALLENKTIKPDVTHSSSFFGASSASVAEEQDPLDYYQTEVQKLVNSEVRTIHALNFGITMLQSTATSLQSVPSSSSSSLLFQPRGRAFLEEIDHGGSHKKSCMLL